MQGSIALAALVMGLAGGPHCVVMCGAACAGLASTRPRGAASTWVLLRFHAGRVAGYAALGALAAASMQGVGWLTVQSAALRPLWTAVHVLALLLGLMLLVQARPPAWLENAGRGLWMRVRAAADGGAFGMGSFFLGMAWALLPCGLLYSALMVAALAGGPLQGAATMAIFVLGTSVSLMAGPWLWLRLRNSAYGNWGMRLAGLLLAVSALFALWMGLMHDQAPWCVTPPVA